MNKRRTVMALAVVGLGGCGVSGGSGGSGTSAVDGTALGTPIQVVDAVSAAYSFQTNGRTINGASIVMSTSSNLCNDLRANVQHPSTSYVTIWMSDRTGDMLTTPSAPGEYTIDEDQRVVLPKPAGISIIARNATCLFAGDKLPYATSGTVELSSLNGNVFDGTFDVTLNTGEHLTGAFAPTSCPGIDTFAHNPQGAACQ